jgi:pre-rRNA-processing protein TSR2
MELRSGAAKQQNLLPAAAKAAFEEGAKLLFRRWTALCLAVDQEWGGAGSADKANWLLQESCNWFYSSKGAAAPTSLRQACSLLMRLL